MGVDATGAGADTTASTPAAATPAPTEHLSKDVNKDAIDIITGMFHDNHMERLNLNVPAETREKIRRIARRRQIKEAEAARELLIAAVENEEREEFYRQLEQAQTPELRRRLLAITQAMEKIGGSPR